MDYNSCAALVVILFILGMQDWNFLRYGIIILSSICAVGYINYCLNCRAHHICQMGKLGTPHLIMSNIVQDEVIVTMELIGNHVCP